MATEYKLSYTAAEINNKLGQVEQLFEEIEDLKAGGGGSGTSNLETEVADVPLYIEWDGSNYSSLENVATWYYKISDIVPTEEQVAQGGWYIYDSGSGAKHSFYISESDDFISLGSVAAPRIYKEGNSVGASPGIYFYRSSASYRTISLRLEGYKVSEVVKLNEKHLPEVDVVPRQYGGLSGSTYNVPNIKVDSTGRVIEASESVLSTASTKGTGLMPAAMYSNIYNNEHVAVQSGSYTVNLGWTTGLTNCKVLTAALSSETLYVPIVYAAYAYIYTDASKTTKKLVPIEPIMMASSTSNAWCTLSCPAEYQEFNYVDGDPDGSLSYVDYIVIYEKAYYTSSGH